MQEQRLIHLKSKGFNPNFVIDIGACEAEWTKMAKAIFTTASYLMIEANKDNEPKLMTSGFPYKIALLGDKESANVDFYKINQGYNTGNSIFQEQTRHYMKNENFHIETLSMTTLDKLLEVHTKKHPDFIKMDVQGAELLILEGSKETLKTVEFILLETQVLEYNKNAPKIYDVMKYMDEIGFETYDILDPHYLPTNDLMQLDVLFVRKNSKWIKKGMLD